MVSSCFFLPYVTGRGKRVFILVKTFLRKRDVTISPLGLYFDARMDDLQEGKQLSRAISSITYVMIRSDGTLYENNEEFGLSTGTTYNEDDEYIHITGAWKADGPMNVCILDLSEYCGIEINGIPYYFAAPDIF